MSTPLINLIRQLPETRLDTPSHRQLSNNAFRAVDEFIQRNRNSVNERDNERNTPLHWVVIKQYDVLIRLLLNNGADINARNMRSDTPLHFAVLPPGNVDSVETLLLENADTTIRNSQDATAFDIAMNIAETVENDDYEDIIALLEEDFLRSPTRPIPGRIEEYPEFAESPFWEKYSSIDEVVCSICTEPLVDGTPVCVNKNCQHGFHCNCIRPWLQRNNNCPLCRAPFKLLRLNEMQQKALQNSFGKKRKNNINQLTKFKKYLNKL